MPPKNTFILTLEIVVLNISPQSLFLKNELSISTCGSAQKNGSVNICNSMTTGLAPKQLLNGRCSHCGLYVHFAGYWSTLNDTNGTKNKDYNLHGGFVAGLLY